jgi:hypothetical protein
VISARSNEAGIQVFITNGGASPGPATRRLLYVCDHLPGGGTHVVHVTFEARRTGGIVGQVTDGLREPRSEIGEVLTRVWKNRQLSALVLADCCFLLPARKAAVDHMRSRLPGIGGALLWPKPCHQ